LADQVWYIQLLEKSCVSPGKTIDFPNNTKATLPSFPREILDLNSEFTKISTTYKLFDGYDNNLLRLSQANFLTLSESVSDSFVKAFSYGAVANGKSKNPDLQNDKLCQFINALHDKKEQLDILDFGAGFGRTFFEVSKVKSTINKVRWSFWEPFTDVRAALKEKINETENAILIEGEEGILKSHYDLVVISNVLHECNPDDFSIIISKAAEACSPSGYVIIIELYPLLHPEKYAVPYSKDDMKKIMRDSGFTVESTSVNIKNSSVSAYWIKAKKIDVINIDKVKESVDKQWEIILDRACGDYKGKHSIDSPEDIVQVMGELTTIASIQSYKIGEWCSGG